MRGLKISLKMRAKKIKTPRSKTKTIIVALRILADEIRSDDGIANAAILEAADRLEEMSCKIRKLKLKLASQIEYPRW